MKNKKIIFLILCIVLIVMGIIIFTKIFNKASKNGNTKIDKTTEGITEYILNISSYEATIDITIIANKNETKYQVKQSYVSPNISKQIVIEPNNIKNLTTIFDGSNLKVENTKLNLTTIYENYEYITQNNLFLNFFIEDYKTSNSTKVEEKNDMIVMETKCKDSNNKYQIYKKLYIDKNTATPIKMEVQDNNQNTTVYILYNEIKINSTQKEEVLAFKSMENKQQI